MTRALLALLVAWLALADRAEAYPHFQLSSDTATCSGCHLAPAGGGLLTEWGREESADTLSRGGDGGFLHGVELPSWLVAGGDLRLAALANWTGATEGTEVAVFPMQADLAARVVAGAWSMGGTVGLRGAVRGGSPSPSWTSYLVSREHYAMWRPGGGHRYARAGRFFAPYGLRLADHTAYVRRYLGYNLLEETYGVNVGWVTGRIEAHATGFVSDPLRGAARDERGGAAMIEGKWSATVLGASARVGASDADVRSSLGVHAKWWWARTRLLWQAELDGVFQRFDGPGDRWQLAGYVGPTWVVSRGLYLGAAYELFDEDLVVRKVERHALGSWLSFHPRAHLELMLSGRAQRIGTTDSAYVGLLQAHYYL